MHNVDIVYFSLVLFAALVVLSHWTARRTRSAARVKRGLLAYASGSESHATAQESGDDFIAVQ